MRRVNLTHTWHTDSDGIQWYPSLYFVYRDTFHECQICPSLILYILSLCDFIHFNVSIRVRTFSKSPTSCIPSKLNWLPRLYTRLQPFLMKRGLTFLVYYCLSPYTQNQTNITSPWLPKNWLTVVGKVWSSLLSYLPSQSRVTSYKIVWQVLPKTHCVFLHLVTPFRRH